MSIYIESRPVKRTGDTFDHTYLVYKPDVGEEKVIGGKPRGVTLDVYTGPLAESDDRRGPGETSADRGGVELDLGGRDAATVWQDMESNAIDNYEGLPYLGPISNSNSLISGLLTDAGIPLELPSNTSDWATPGWIDGPAFPFPHGMMPMLPFIPPLPSSPLAVDLDSDGIETVGTSADIHFDHDGDTFRELSGFVAADDGVLALDRNGDGKINSGAELFGNQTVLADGSLAEHGYEALAELDSNSDGVVDTNDTRFGDLRVFKDLDQDGETDTGELLTLSEAGIKALSLEYTEQSYEDEFGNEFRQVGSYTTTADQVMTMADVWFTRDLADTEEELIDVPSAIAILPNAQGFGRARSLHQAMARDTEGTLKQLVTQFVNASSHADRLALTESIIFSWTGQTGEYRAHHRAPIDTRKIGALEAFYGEDIGNPRGSGRQYAEIFDGIFQNLVDGVFFQLAAQSYLSPFFDEITWTQDAKTGVWLGDFSQVVDDLFAFAKAEPDSALDTLTGFAQAIRGAKNVDRLRAAMDQYMQTADISGYSDETVGVVTATTMHATVEADSINGTANANILFGLGGDDTLNGQAGNDVLDGGAGNDVLTGGSGNDEYRFGVGSGHDRIRNNDTGTGRRDVVKLLGDLTATDITVTRSADDLVISITGTEDVLRIEGHFEGEGTARKYIDAIVFSDGTEKDVGPTQFDKINVASQVISEGNDDLHGTSAANSIDGLGGDDAIFGKDGADTLTGSAGNDTLHGDAGNDTLKGGNDHDTLYGGAGDDTLYGNTGDDLLIGGSGSDGYCFNSGDGFDVIDNRGTSGDVDTLTLGSGILSENVRVRRSGNDLIILVKENVDEVRIRNWYDDETNQIDSLVFSDSSSTDSSWSAAVMEAATHKATAYSDELHGEDGNDTLDGLAGDDVLVGHDGDDTLSGSAGNDTLHGEDGNDTLSGGENNDTLYGGRGNDRLTGGSGDDQLEGGSGGDTYVIAVGSGHDVIQDYDNTGSDLDQLTFTDVNPSGVTGSYSGDDLILTLSNGETITLKDQLYSNGRYGLEKVVFADGTEWNRLDLMKAGGRVVGTSYAESYTHALGDGSYQIEDYSTRSGEDDQLTFTDVNPSGVTGSYSGDDLILTLSNGETITLKDQLYSNGRYGLEKVVFADGTEWNRQGLRNALLVGGDGDDNIVGFSNGNDTLRGGAGNDTLSGEDGNDTLYGESGNDVLYGGNGDDALYGGEGDDTLYGHFGADSLDGGAGTDTADFTYASTADVTFDLSAGTAVFSSGTETLVSIENVTGTGGANTITGTAGANRLDGHNGNDTLVGAGGADTLLGGLGADTFVFRADDGADTIEDFEDGSDTIRFEIADLGFSDLSISDDNGDAVVGYDTDDSIRIANTSASDLEAGDFVFA